MERHEGIPQLQISSVSGMLQISPLPIRFYGSFWAGMQSLGISFNLIGHLHMAAGFPPAHKASKQDVSLNWRSFSNLSARKAAVELIC